MNIESVASSLYQNLNTSGQRVGENIFPGQEIRLNTDIISISNEARIAAQQDKIYEDFSERALSYLRTTLKISEAEIRQFRKIVKEAESSSDAKSFLKSLSWKDRKLVKQANSYGHNLTDDVIDRMSQEGARNMILQPDYRDYVDYNNDGVVEKGLGRSFVFPPPNSPEAVKDAWDKTMENLPEKERLLASTIFFVQSLNANLKRDNNGKVIGFYHAGEAGYKNIFPADTGGWFALFDKIDDYLEQAQHIDPSRKKHYEKYRSLISNFRNNLKQIS